MRLIFTRRTVDQDFSVHPQLFLTEQGYRYVIQGEDDPVEDGARAVAA